MVFTCSSCNRCFNTLMGLNIHRAKCLTFIAKEVYNVDYNDDYLNNDFTSNQDHGEVETSPNCELRTLLIESINDEQNDHYQLLQHQHLQCQHLQPNLLPYIQVDPVLPNQHNNLEENAEQQIREVPANIRWGEMTEINNN